MTPHEIYRIKEALKVLEYAGPQGVGRDALLGQTEIATGQILTSSEKDRLLETLTEKQWAYSFRDPLSGNIRYVLTGPGTLARNAL